MDQELEQLYRAEEKLGTVFLAFSILAIFIACIGLLGLASFTADRRTKEIGVRKVLGSNSLQIIFLLTRDFSRWVIWANFLAWPFAFYFVSNWLNHFAYRAPVRPVFFLAAAFLSILVAWGTVLFHAARSAWRNPVDSLRYE